MLAELKVVSRMPPRLLQPVATFALLVLVVFSPSAAAVPTVTCDTSWTGPVTGFWDVAANWTNGVPTSSSNACITNASRVIVRGTNNVAAGLTLDTRLEVTGSNEAGDAKLTLLDQGRASGGVRDFGFLVLTSTDANAAATVDVAGGTLDNLGGWIMVDPGAGGSGGRFWHGALYQNQGVMELKESLTVLGAEPWRTSGSLWLRSGTTLRVDSGVVIKKAFLSLMGEVQGDTTVLGGFVWNAAPIGPLNFGGNYTQGNNTRLYIRIAGPNAGEFDVLTVAGTATIGGLLSVGGGFDPTLGQMFPIVTAASRSGTFRQLAGAVIDRPSATYYAPTYPPNGVTLEVRQATMNLTPPQGPPGTSVTLTGNGWVAGDTVRPVFLGSGHVKLKFPRATVDDSGNFSATITIPSNAAPGPATVTAESNIINGLIVKRTFTVTP